MGNLIAISHIIVNS